MYNLEVEEDHSYSVNGLAAHNCWFNVGVEPKPQASACFILSIEDTMESILEWYRTEGLIFKGGSGSGVNLSKLRSSKERLSSGGMASGPVSFMRGADAIAGTIKSGGKCFRKGTLIATPEGWRPIETLRIGDLVLTHRGPCAVADFMPNGLKQCYKVRTREGYEVEVTQGHKFACWNAYKGCFEVKPIEDFKPGEALYVLLEPSEGGTSIPLVVPEGNDPPNATTTVEMKFPTELNEELAYVVGLTYGDAELRTEYPYRLRIAFCKDQAGYASAERFREYCVFLFGEEPLLLGDEKGHQQLGFTRKRLIEFLVANGLAKGKAEALGFPKILFQARPKVRAAFIAGVIDADGTYQARGGWSISSIDRAFLVEFQRLLLTLGIPSKLTLNREQNGSWRPLYRLSVVGYTFVKRLVEHITPHSAKAVFNYEPSDGADKGWGCCPSLYTPLVSRVERRGGYRLIERTVGINETTGYGALVKLATHPDVAVADYAEELSHCIQVTLESVEPTGVAETYDIEVADVHLLSANGLYASNTRRAAKMVILNVDHPDIEEFIWCKAKEERKAYALAEAGYDLSLDGEAWVSIQYQNANNSVRVTDDFMRAVLEDKEWPLKAVTTGEVLKTVRARDLMRQIAQAAWECADPGVQYDTTINDWHTVPNSGRINASNPCFPGDARVFTDKGLIPFRELIDRVNKGESFQVYTHRATARESGEGVILSSPTQFMITGVNDVYRLRFDNGAEIRCTGNHHFFTKNRGMVPARELTSEDQVVLNDTLALPVFADWAIPVSADWEDYRAKYGHHRLMNLPSKWTSEFAELLGHLTGDGSIGETMVTWVYGSKEDQKELMPRHRALLESILGSVNHCVQANGTEQLRVARTPFLRYLIALGFKPARASEKRVPWVIFQAPPEIIAAYLRGLFNADGCVHEAKNSTRYVGLGSKSLGLLQDVQKLLLSFGIATSIYSCERGDKTNFRYTRKDGTNVTYQSMGPSYDLRISSQSLKRFYDFIGFSLLRKQKALAEMVAHHDFYNIDTTTRLVEMKYDGQEITYNLTEPLHHSYIVDGFVVANCSEYMSLDDTSCNLSSLNLMKLLDERGEFDVEAFKHAVATMILAQEIIVGNASYPTEKIRQNTIAFRQLGLGYANLGALLMARGLPYDSDEGRAYAGAITALMTGHAYATSALIAERMGPFAGFEENREPMLRVMRKHRDALGKIDAKLVPSDLYEAAKQAWDEVVRLGELYGYRNAQTTVLAPTGTISFMMDCDTTGIEPDLALVKYKTLVGGGMMRIVNQTVPLALKRLGYSPDEIRAIVGYVDEKGTIEGAPHLQPEHLPIFDCALRPVGGTRSIHYMGHVRMLAAVQPFISGAISKTINVPSDVTVDEVMDIYIQGWRLGLKALAIYRDSSKKVQPLSAAKEEKERKEPRPIRKRLPDERQAITHKFSVGGQEGYITVGLFDDGTPGEVFLTIAKEGSTVSGLMDVIATETSIALQYGVPLKDLVRKFINTRFEPAGITNNPQIRFATSISDYVFRWLGLKFLPYEDQVELGLHPRGAQEGVPVLPAQAG
ncbi:MAG: LAGLIDADG family homing endonuclease, partial [Candidatus Methylomirabilales bacterium]